MGEAKRRANEIARIKKLQDDWRANLTAEEREIVQVAERLEERLIRAKNFTEGCYHLAFFMTLYLAEKSISVTPVIGWVNDGTWEGVTSHAWIEHNGRRLDVSLTRTSHPEAQPPGDMIVLDQVIRKGRAKYTYYKNNDPTAMKALASLRADPELSALQAQKEAQHRQMIEIAQPGQMTRIEAYLSGAPAGLRYDDLKRLIAS